MNDEKQADKVKEKDISITVNGKPVVVHEKIMTGRQIKQAAIDQGVNIKIEFVLFEDLNNGQQNIVRDADEVKMHNNQRFDCITNDDNS